MTEHYEDADETGERSLSNRKVLGFIARFWLRRPGLFWASVALTWSPSASTWRSPGRRAG